MTVRTISSVLLALALGSTACVELPDDPGAEPGPDAGVAAAEAEPESLLCDTSNIQPKLTLISRTSGSITMQIDVTDPDCRIFLDYYDLDFMGGAIFPKPPEWQLAFGPGYELPVTYTHTGRLPDTEYCYGAKAIEKNRARGVYPCFRTRPLAMHF